MGIIAKNSHIQTYKIEMLVKIEHTKKSVFTAPEKIIGLLALNEDLTFTGRAGQYGVRFDEEDFRLSIAVESPFIFLIQVSIASGDAASVSAKLERLTKVARELKLTISENINGASYEVLWDDAGIHYAQAAYPCIIHIENLMRKLITKFMLVSVGIDFFNEIPDDIRIRESDDRESGFLQKIDFIDLTQYLFHARPLKKMDSLARIINTLRENKLPETVNLLEYQSDSYWNRYFRDTVDRDIDDRFIQKQWEELYKLRCKVAHSRFLNGSEYRRIRDLCEKLEAIFEKALDNLRGIDLSPESKEAISDELFSEIEGGTWNENLYALIRQQFQDAFTLADVYAYEAMLQEMYPNNNTIRASIRRNLQELRNRGKIVFLNSGRYRIVRENEGHPLPPSDVGCEGT